MPQIDPKLAIVWRSENQLQIGAPTARVVLDCPERVQLDLVHLLRHGAGVDTLRAMAAGVGGTPRDVEAILRELKPVLKENDWEEDMRATEAELAAITDQRPVVVSGQGETANTVARVLGLLGHRVERTTLQVPLLDEEGASIVVLVTDRVVPTALHLPLLRRDIVHVPIVFGEGEVVVGPLVTPGESGCLRCADLARRDADAAWPLIAAQLPDQPPVSRPRRLELSAAASVIRAVDARLTGHSSVLDGIAEIILPDASRPRRVSCPPHRDCGCGAHSGTATPHVPPALRPPGDPS
jgi:bacteriocin biosynthesis cyclodehydratase domain-containing protein